MNSNLPSHDVDSLSQVTDNAPRWPANRWVRWGFWGVFSVGLVLRIIAGTHSLGFVHPDEHQQYLEAAQKIVYGYGWTYWEYDRGVRHYLYPGILAGGLIAMDAVGIEDPVHQAMVIRVAMGISILSAIALMARSWVLSGKTIAGLSLLCLTALSPDMIFIGARTLSETALMVPLILGLYFFERRPFVAGLLLGVMFAIRLQSAFLAIAFLSTAVCSDVKKRRLSRDRLGLLMISGLLLSLLIVGYIDRSTWGSWFHSSIEYVRANVVEGKAASFGVEPWYRYLQWIFDFLLSASVLLLPLFLIGAMCETRVLFAIVLFTLAHSIIGHKEPRFLWPLAPLVLMLIALGINVVWNGMNSTPLKAAFIAILGLSLFFGIVLRNESIDWHSEPSQSTSIALASLRCSDNVNGVGVWGVGDAFCGNYFYLRQQVPLVPESYGPSIFTNPSWLDGTINVLLLFDDDDTSYKQHVDLTTVGRVGHITIGRVTQRYGVVPQLGRFVIRDFDDPIQSDLMRGNAWEPYAVKIFEKYVTDGMCVADIGAYNGVHSIRFARLVGATGHVYAFEPNPPAYEMLEKNTALNGFNDRISIYRCGLSNSSTTGYVHLSDDSSNLGGTHIVHAGDVISGRQSARESDLAESVSLIRLDDEPNKWFPRNVGFVKIDVEGAEDRVIEGAREWISTCKPILYVEIWDDVKRSREHLPLTTAEVVSSIESLGYELVQQVGRFDHLFIPK